MEMRFGEWLKRRRRQLALTQKELAYRAGCGLSTLRKIEYGERRPSVELAGFIGQAIGVTDDELPAFIAFARDDPDEIEPPTFAAEQVGPPEPALPAVNVMAAAHKVRHNLPTQATPFIGRETELKTLGKLLTDEQIRLVTILGPGGMGKTRLALAWAETQQLLPSTASPFPDGLYFVNLAPLSDPTHIVSTIAEALRCPGQGGEREARSSAQQLREFLREKRLLLILDNFEHLLNSSSDAEPHEALQWVMNILDAAPDVKVVVTSRERLNLRYEQVYPIQGLAYAEWHSQADAEAYAAVQLFLQSARRNLPDFSLNGEVGAKLRHLARICQVAAGMPLALELAAAWVDLLTLEEIAMELTDSRGQGLDLLASDAPDRPDRQRSMRATFDYSWSKLSAREQAVFAQLSVFRGGFTRPAGLEVSQASLPQLARLVKKSLLQYEREHGRYQIHELLRQFGAEKLAADDALETAVRDRHSTYYCKMMARRAEQIKLGPQAPQAPVNVASIENVQLAWEWAVTQRHYSGLIAAHLGLGSYFESHGRAVDAETLFQKTVVQLEEADAVLENRLVRACSHYWLTRLNVTDRTIEKEHARRGLRILDQLPPEDKEVMFIKAMLLLQTGTLEQSRQVRMQNYTDALALFRSLNLSMGQVRALRYLGADALFYGEFRDAERFLKRSLSLNKEIDNSDQKVLGLITLAQICTGQARVGEAKRYLEESLAIAEKQNSPFLAARAKSAFATVLFLTGRQSEGIALLDEYMRWYKSQNNSIEAAGTSAELGRIFAFLGDMIEGRRLSQEAVRLSLEAKRKRSAYVQALITFCILAAHEGDYDLAAKHARDAWHALQAYGNVGLKSEVSVWIAVTEIGLGNMRRAKRAVWQALTLSGGWVRYGALRLAAYLLSEEASPALTANDCLRLALLYESAYLVARCETIKTIMARFQPKALTHASPELIATIREETKGLDPEEVIAELVPRLAKMGWAPESDHPGSSLVEGSA